jgi:hypothetical protein
VEVTEQTGLLNRIGSHVDHAEANVKRETEAIEKFDVSGGNIALYVVIGLLAVIVIVLLATDGVLGVW